MNHFDSIIETLQVTAHRATARTDESEANGPAVFPVASDQDIEHAESRLGFQLPLLLRRIYSEIGNGGPAVKPGISGLPSGFEPNGCDDNVVDFYLTLIAYDQDTWPRRLLSFCDWGCNMYSCVLCGTDDGPVYRFDGNDHEEGDQFPEASCWELEASSLSQWLFAENWR